MKEQVLENLQRRAFDARITMTELCKRAKVSPATISRWRSKDKPTGKPWPQTVLKLERVLDELEAQS